MKTIASFFVILFAFSLVCQAQDMPYPPGKTITGIEIDWSTHQRHALGSDNFQLTWSDDGHQYGVWGDGGGFAEAGKYRVSFGVARIEGDYDNYKGFDRYGHKESSEAEAAIKGKSWGIISIEGILYTWVHPDRPGAWGDWAYHHKEARLYMSKDKGATWEAADWAFTQEENLIGGNILQFGKDYAGAKDKYVYHYMVHPNIVMDNSGRITENTGKATELQVPGMIYLLRVNKNTMMDKEAYEFFAGLKGKKAKWTRNINEKQPVFTNKNGVGSPIGISYNAGLKRYLLTTEHDKAHSGMLGIYEAPTPWGPWYTVHYAISDTWFGHDNAETVPQNCFFWCFPTKWISKDGRSATMVFTGGGRGANNDSFNTVRIRFLE